MSVVPQLWSSDERNRYCYGMTIMKNAFCAVCVVLILNQVCIAQVDFGRKIRPLLSDKCFACHGLDAEKREGGLRLDTQEGLFGKGDSNSIAVAPSKPSESSVYQRLISEDPDEQMPPKDSDKSLTKQEIQLIKEWIEQGAVWEQHWSLVAPVRPPQPQLSGDERWPRNEIDRFVLAKLIESGMRPAEEADKAALLRRVTYDLTGLPPKPDEIVAFLSDDSSGAYEAVVDRLLKSPHYGEHRARFWLDAARYGDTHGLHLDNYRVMWPYRDWVVKAFNDNMPFDQFTIEQLAGDLLPSATQEQILATGFNRCNVTTSEGGALPEEYEVIYTNDRVATMSTVWMGISMGCVTCHESKFDPFEMKDFYQLYAFFNNLDGPVMDGNAKDTAPMIRLTTQSQRDELATLTNKVSEANNVLVAPNEQVDRDQQQWEVAYRAMMSEPTNWEILIPKQYSSARNASFEKLEDESLLVGGPNANQDVYEIVSQVPAGNLSAIRLEGLTHPTLTLGGAGRSANSNVVLTEFEAEFAELGVDNPEWKPLKFSRAWADHEQTNGNFKVRNAIDGDSKSGWAIEGHQLRENRSAIFAFETSHKFDQQVQLRVRLRHESVYAQHQFGRIRLAITADSEIPQIEMGKVPDKIAKLIGQEVASRDETQKAAVRDHYRTNVSTNPTIRTAISQLKEATERKKQLEDSLPQTLVWKETEKPKRAHILLRGAYDKPGDEVFRNTPAALPPLAAMPDGRSPNRLDLAKWLLSPEHPLTARVTVNRFWQQYFGTGIVETTEDFGSQGALPTHPELLDWLAVDFRESGWDVKRLHKMIVMSATYRQSARTTPQASEADPRNRLLARAPRFRLDAELIRDTALISSGLLVDKLGGPSVKPYQPPGIWEAVGYTDSNTAKFTRDTGEALYRRSLYTFWKRTAPPPTMVTFDAPSRETCTVRRPRTNTPLAALALMNDEQFVEASRVMAERVIKCGGEDNTSRLKFAFLITVSREPTAAELKVAIQVLLTELDRYSQDAEAAKKLLSVGESKPDPSLEAAQVAAWSVVSNMLLNLDETISK